MYSDYFTVTTNHPGPEVFRRSPFSSYYFLTPTIVLALAIVSAAVVFGRFRSALSLNSEVAIITCCVAIVTFWARGFRDWRRIRSTIGSSEVLPGTPLYLALGVAAAQICYGFTFLGLVAGGLFAAIGHLSNAAVR